MVNQELLVTFGQAVLGAPLAATDMTVTVQAGHTLPTIPGQFRLTAPLGPGVPSEVILLASPPVGLVYTVLQRGAGGPVGATAVANGSSVYAICSGEALANAIAAANAISLQGTPVQNVQPTQGQLLSCDGTNWTPDGPIGGDVRGRSLRELYIGSVSGLAGNGGPVTYNCSLHQMQDGGGAHIADWAYSGSEASINLVGGAGSYSSVKSGGSRFAAIGQNTAGGGFGLLWLGNGVVPGSTTYTLGCNNAGLTILNGNTAGSSIYIQINASTNVAIFSAAAQGGIQFLQPVGGLSGTPYQQAVSTPQSVTGASVVLSNAQIATPIIPLTGTVNASNCTITLPNVVGATWDFDLSGVTFGGHSIIFTTGSGTSATITALKAGGYTGVRAFISASNVVSAA